MTARHAGRDVLIECIRRIDVKRGAAGELNRVFDFQVYGVVRRALAEYRQWSSDL
jgi:hypothetical protein